VTLNVTGIIRTVNESNKSLTRGKRKIKIRTVNENNKSLTRGQNTIKIDNKSLTRGDQEPTTEGLLKEGCNRRFTGVVGGLGVGVIGLVGKQKVQCKIYLRVVLIVLTQVGVKGVCVLLPLSPVSHAGRWDTFHPNFGVTRPTDVVCLPLDIILVPRQDQLNIV